MPDRSINLGYNKEGELEMVTKTIGDKELSFRFNGHEAVYTGTSCFKGRINSSADTWVPKNQFIAACRQATAIFKSKQNHKPLLPQSQLALTH